MLSTLLRDSRYDEALPELKDWLETAVQMSEGARDEYNFQLSANEYIEILSALIRLIEQTRWQSMESAPRDGRRFLHCDGSIAKECWFSKAINDFTFGKLNSDWNEIAARETSTLRFWQPLPLPPKPKAGGDDE